MFEFLEVGTAGVEILRMLAQVYNIDFLVR